jgi:hypothetical protein
MTAMASGGSRNSMADGGWRMGPLASQTDRRHLELATTNVRGQSRIGTPEHILSDLRPRQANNTVDGVCGAVYLTQGNGNPKLKGVWSSLVAL